MKQKAEDGPLWRLDRDERTAIALGHVGQQVEIVIDPLRRNDSILIRTYRGRVLAVAGPVAATTTKEIIVFANEGGTGWAALATVRSITRITPAPKGNRT